MAMTKKDYDLIAKAMATQRRQISDETVIKLEALDETIETMAAHMALVNEKFNMDAFLEASLHGKGRNT